MGTIWKRLLVFGAAVVVGFFVSDFIAGTETGVPGRVSPILIPIGSRLFHLHHWIMGIAGLVLVAALAYPRRSFLRNHHLFLTLTVGLLSGIVAQGILRYDDWFVVWEP